MARRIAFCHIDSLSCLPALNALFDELGGEIGLVLSAGNVASDGLSGRLRKATTGTDIRSKPSHTFSGMPKRRKPALQAYAPDFIVSMNFDQILQPR